MKSDTTQSELVAPCGIDCSTCSAYLAYQNGVPKKRGSVTHCTGCRPRNKQCAFLKGHCELLRRGKVEFCFQCGRYPCARLQHLDQRYRRDYRTSLIENLEEIRTKGVNAFLRNQQKRFGCPGCGGKISVHNRKCYACDTIVSWKDLS